MDRRNIKYSNLVNGFCTHHAPPSASTWADVEEWFSYGTRWGRWRLRSGWRRGGVRLLLSLFTFREGVEADGGAEEEGDEEGDGEELTVVGVSSEEHVSAEGAEGGRPDVAVGAVVEEDSEGGVRVGGRRRV